MELTHAPAGEAVLIFCCSGAADVGEIAHQAARRLDEQGRGMRFCLAGVGGRVPAHLGKCRAAQAILVIDGCHVSCGQRTLAEAGFTQVLHLGVHEVGLAKGTSAPTPEHVQRVVTAACSILDQAPKDRPR